MNINVLKGLIPDSVLSQIDEVSSKFLIDTPIRLSHFLSQCSHESNGFSAIRENLNYSSEGLIKIFSKYFTVDLAAKYARNPEKIANRVYANRMENLNEESGDGWKYRGRGYIQLTGKDNYSKFDKFVDEDILSNPDLVASKYPLLSAGWFWHVNKLNLIADKGFGNDTIIAVTKRINGGTHGLEDRTIRFNKIYPLLKN